MFFISLLSLVTGCGMLALCIADIRGDIRNPNWRLCRSLDVIAYSFGFVCVILTSLYALISALIWL